MGDRELSISEFHITFKVKTTMTLNELSNFVVVKHKLPIEDLGQVIKVEYIKEIED